MHLRVTLLYTCRRRSSIDYTYLGCRFKTGPLIARCGILVSSYFVHGQPNSRVSAPDTVGYNLAIDRNPTSPLRLWGNETQAMHPYRTGINWFRDHKGLVLGRRPPFTERDSSVPIF